MSVTSEEIKRTYTGNGTTDTYAYPFRIYKAADILVTETVIATGVETVLAYTTDYTLTGINDDLGGNVVLTAGVLPSTKKLTLELNLEYKQELVIPPADPFPAKTTEGALDKLVRMIQQVKALLTRTFILPTTVTTPITMPVPEAGKVLTGVSATEVAWEALAYTTTSFNGTISRGLASAKPATPSVGDIYLETDTGILYVCLASNVWTKYNIDINIQTNKATPLAADIFLIESAADTYAQRKLTLANLITAVRDYKVKADSGDATPGFLSDKVDGTSIQVSATDKLEVLPSIIDIWKGKQVKTLQMATANAAATANGISAIVESGELKVWGNMVKVGQGQQAIYLQHPTTAALPSEATLPIKQVIVEHSNIYCVDANGKVFGAGLNAEGELGDGTVTDDYTRKIWRRIGASTFVDGITELFATRGGTLGPIISIFALKSNGSLWAWGCNTSGQLGVGSVVNVTTPTQVPAPSEGGGATWAKVFSHGTTTTGFTCAISSTGKAYMTGHEGTEGKMGHGTASSSRSAFGLLTHANIASKVFIKASLSGETTNGTVILLANDGTLWGMGANNYGQLADGTTTASNIPIRVAAGLSTVTDIISSMDEYGSIYCVLADKTVRCWGYNGDYQLCDDSSTNRTAPVNPATLEPGIADVKKILIGGTGSYNHVLILTNGGDLWGGGNGLYGGRGDGYNAARTTVNKFWPCCGYPQGKITDISMGGSNNYPNLIALASDGRMFVAGDNTSGCCGIGSVLTCQESFAEVIF